MDFLISINRNVLYVLAFAFAFVISLMMTPLSKKIAMKVGAIDQPKAIGVHKKAMPLAGGSAIVTGFIISALIFAPAMPDFKWVSFIGLMVGSILITTLGFFDDIFKLSPRFRIIIQVLAALIIVLTGTTIEILTWPWASYGVIKLGSLGKLITIIWIVGLTNAVNFIDGLDGLAAGIASIAAVSFMVVAFIFSTPIAVILSAILAGACLGFLPHNFNPATIFMGDTGSTFLGFTLAVVSIQGLTKGYTIITVIIAAMVLGLPILDTSFAILRRLINKQSITQGDRGHLHHRLVDKGISHKSAVLTLYVIAGGFGLAGVLVALEDILLAALIIAFIMAAWVFDIFYTVHKEKKNIKKDII